MIQSPEGMEV